MCCDRFDPGSALLYSLQTCLFYLFCELGFARGRFIYGSLLLGSQTLDGHWRVSNSALGIYETLHGDLLGQVL